MRRVYSPPEIRTGWLAPSLGAAGITLLVFLVLPLTQMVSSRAQRQLLLTPIDSTTVAPPVENTPPPEPPPPEEAPEEAQPKLAEATEALSLTIPELDIAVGSGGALLAAGLPGDAAREELSQIAAFDVADLDQPPTVANSISPVYPRELQKARVEGMVVLLFVVDEQGRVEDPRVESSSRPEFEKPALDALRRWKFRPGMKEGQPVKAYMRLPMRFRMNS